MRAMFLRRIVLCVGLLAVLAPGVRALDFQLHSEATEEDGFRRERWFFRWDEKTNVYIDPPAGWMRAEESGSLTLTAAGEAGSLIRLEKSPLTPDLPFADKGLETYRRRALAAVPQGATGIGVVEEHSDPLPIFRWKSYEFVVDYVFFGRAFRRSTVFLDLNVRDQIMVTIVAPAAGYDRTRGSAFDLLRSWQVLPAR